MVLHHSGSSPPGPEDLLRPFLFQSGVGGDQSIVLPIHVWAFVHRVPPNVEETYITCKDTKEQSGDLEWLSSLGLSSASTPQPPPRYELPDSAFNCEVRCDEPSRRSPTAWIMLSLPQVITAEEMSILDSLYNFPKHPIAQQGEGCGGKALLAGTHPKVRKYHFHSQRQCHRRGITLCCETGCF